MYEDYVIDHREIYEECQHRYGSPSEIALKSTYNPKSGKYYGFSDSYVPDPVNYRKDLWDDVGVFPSNWENILDGGLRFSKSMASPWAWAWPQNWTQKWRCVRSCTVSVARFRMKRAG